MTIKQPTTNTFKSALKSFPKPRFFFHKKFHVTVNDAIRCIYTFTAEVSLFDPYICMNRKSVFDFSVLQCSIRRSRARYVEVELDVYWDREKTERVYFHPYKPVSWLLTHRGILLFLLRFSPNEIVITKQACTDESILSLYFPISIYIEL